ncbi:hypothetical protein EDD16DRAFT_1708645 [Pisolithus croceorrhizus]|nr:hypothetical protein EDD16DRAFT_1708645 [Pisolithus croceorrhizus]
MVELPWMILDQFSGSFLQRLADQNVVFRNAYFVHEVCGVKGASIHRLDNLPGAQSTLDEMLDHLDLHAINDENWFIDVGLEIGWQDHMVTWFADGHELLLQNVLNQSSHQAVGKLMKSKKFKTDHMALLKDCAGFRAEMTVRIRDSDHVNYICTYCTEKNVHYQRHPSLYRYRHADELQIPEKHKKIIDDLNTMSETLAECSGTQGTLQTGSARLEVRVPLRQAITANRFFNEHLLELTVVSIPAKTWWTFKYYRLTAVRMVLQSLLDVPGTLRTHPSSLVLGVATIWIMNGCYYRPGERFGSDHLSQACCQKALANPDDDAEDPNAEVKPSMYDRGMYFLSDIVVDDALGYRLPIQCEVDEEVLLLVYNRGSMLDIQSVFGMNVIRNSRRVNPERSNNR